MGILEDEREKKAEKKNVKKLGQINLKLMKVMDLYKSMKVIKFKYN